MAIFAEELVLILRDHGLTPSYLYSRYYLHKETVRRMLRSLSERRYFHVLNPDNLALLGEDIPLTQSERTRLEVAILATAIERMLSDRLPPDQADRTSARVYAALLAEFKTEPRDAPHIFVSHSSQDADLVAQFVVDLRRAGAEIWVDFENIEHGDFMKRINEGLRISDWMVVVISPASLQSEAVEMEVNAALELERHHEFNGVIPFVIAPFEPTTMPPLWRPLHRYDAAQDYQEALKGVLKAVGIGGV